VPPTVRSRENESCNAAVRACSSAHLEQLFVFALPLFTIPIPCGLSPFVGTATENSGLLRVQVGRLRASHSSRPPLGEFGDKTGPVAMGPQARAPLGVERWASTASPRLVSPSTMTGPGRDVTRRHLGDARRARRTKSYKSALRVPSAWRSRRCGTSARASVPCAAPTRPAPVRSARQVRVGRSRWSRARRASRSRRQRDSARLRWGQ
jgi:hypothetical protein